MDWESTVDESLRSLRDVVGHLRPDDWARPTPCGEWNVTQVLQHAAGDQLGWASAMTGGPKPGFDPFAPSGTIDGDPLAFLDIALDASVDAWSKVAHDQVAVVTPLPQGPLPAEVAAGACALDAAVHAWDIAVATRQPEPIGEHLAVLLLAVAREVVEPLRDWGAYAPALAPLADDSQRAALLRYLGRNPGWTPA